MARFWARGRTFLPRNRMAPVAYERRGNNFPGVCNNEGKRQSGWNVLIYDSNALGYVFLDLR